MSGPGAGLAIAVLDYEAGNTRSALRALRTTGADVRITSVPEEAQAADALVIPGVGHFRSCRDRLVAHGLESLVRRWIADGRHLFGICVGMQLLYEGSEEGADHGELTAGLGLLPGVVRRLETDLPVPHMGWDVVAAGPTADPLLDGIVGERAYFVHAYYADPTDHAHVVGTCTYGGTTFPCVARHGNVVGTQFHPEKSSSVGARLLANWTAQVAADLAGPPRTPDAAAAGDRLAATIAGSVAPAPSDVDAPLPDLPARPRRNA